MRHTWLHKEIFELYAPTIKWKWVKYTETIVEQFGY